MEPVAVETRGSVYYQTPLKYGRVFCSCFLLGYFACLNIFTDRMTWLLVHLQCARQQGSFHMLC